MCTVFLSQFTSFALKRLTVFFFNVHDINVLKLLKMNTTLWFLRLMQAQHRLMPEDPNISLYILQTVRHTFPEIVTGRWNFLLGLSYS